MSINSVAHGRQINRGYSNSFSPNPVVMQMTGIMSVFVPFFVKHSLSGHGRLKSFGFMDVSPRFLCSKVFQSYAKLNYLRMKAGE